MNCSNTPRTDRFGFGLELTPDRPIKECASLAARAETSGLDAVFVSSHFDNRDPFQTLATVGRATDDLPVGPGVVNPIETHPVRLATQIATLAESHPGRVLAGIGAGDAPTLSKMGLEHDQPVRRVAEAIEIIRRLNAGDRVDHDGCFDLSGTALSFGPTSVPLYVGAQGPTMLRMAAELADGVLINAAHPSAYRIAREHLAIGERRRESSRDPLHVVGFVCVSVAEEREAAFAAARPPVAFVVAGSSQAILERHGIDHDRAVAIRSALETGDHDAAYQAVTDRMRSTFSVAGTVADVTERLVAIATDVDALVAGAPLGPERDRAIRLLGRVRERLRDQAVIAP